MKCRETVVDARVERNGSENRVVVAADDRRRTVQAARFMSCLCAGAGHSTQLSDLRWFVAAFALVCLLEGCVSHPRTEPDVPADARTPSTDLKWEVLTVKRPGRDLPPGQEELRSVAWIANSSTLISGKRDAVLVDTFLTAEQSRTLADWVAKSGKSLTTIYITHGHPDHFLGLALLLERFPDAKAVASPDVVRAMQDYLSSGKVDGLRKSFPGQIPDHLVVARALEGNVIELEGQRLIVVNAGRTDTAHSTCLYVPSVGLLVAGDTVYNGIYPFLGETDTQSRLEWVSTLDKLEALKPRFVVSGHKVPENADVPGTIDDTRRYLLDFNRMDAATTSARQLYERMYELYPNRINPGSIWNAANTAKKPPG
jgi:glyoxylase-like metal-dependent hydrolase (beta-lactamase superfamily II)